MQGRALRGLKVGLFAGACYWFMDTLVMFAVLEWKMASPTSGLCMESVWLLLGSLGIYGGLGLLTGALMSVGLGPIPRMELDFQRARGSERFARVTRRGPLKALARLPDTLAIQAVLVPVGLMHVLVLLVSPEVDDIMKVGFLTVHLGVALTVLLGATFLLRPRIAAVLALVLLGVWVKVQDRGFIADKLRAEEAPAPTAAAPAGDRPNIVWFVADTTRRDHLPIYGYERPTAPFLSEVAAQGVVFDDAYANAPWTLASHAGMFSGEYSSRNRCTHETLFLSFETSTLAEILEEAGYRTLLFAGNPWLQDFTGLAQGYQDVFASWRAYTVAQVFVLGRAYEDYIETAQDKGARASNQAAREELDRRRADQPFFWFFNYLEPHAPYHQIPDDFAMMFQEPGTELDEVDQVSRNIMSDMMFSTGYRADERSLEVALANYDGGIRYTDDKVREVVEMLRDAGELDDTLFIFSADHGELFGKDGIWGHELSLDDALIRVPLVVWGKGVEGGRRVDAPVQLLDVLPTLVEAIAGAERIPPGVQGRSLWQTAATPDPQRPVFAEYFNPSHPSLKETALQLGMDPTNLRIKTVKVGSLKYVEGPSGRRALYDVAVDPEERTDLSAQRPEDAEIMASLLARFVADSESGGAGGGAGGAPAMDRATCLRLQALGYVEDCP